MDKLLNPPAVSPEAAAMARAFGITMVNTDKSDIKSVVRAHLISLKAEVKASMGAIPDEMSRYHLQDILERIDKALNPKD
ncbi:MAG: hypothetical protein JSU05_14970, partial [Bacteroidetes bacterium]|nr:hypothetical protein [Bacteroidota bacterium]